MNDVAILNFNMGNLFSVKCALNYVGLKSVVTDNAEIIKNSKSLIIPGVGAFPEAMKRLKEKKLDINIIKAQERIEKILGLKINISNKKNNSGKITIEYKDLEQFELVSNLLTKN